MKQYIYLVLAKYDSYVKYGVDTRTYISGVYLTEDEAKKRIKYLKKELALVIIEQYELENSKTYKDKQIFYNNAEKRLGFPIKPYFDDDWDVSFTYYGLEVGDINHFFAGGASYAE